MRSLAVGAILAGLAAHAVGAQPLDARLPTCFACHGENGTSQLPEIPSLGAQPAFYATVQLLMFRDKLRVTEPMNEMAKGLTDADLQKAADIISKLPPPQPVSDNARPRAHGQGARAEPAAPLQFLSPGQLCRAGKRSPAGRPARGLSAQGACAATRTIRAAATTPRCRRWCTT